MSELMSNPQSEPQPRSTAPSGPVAQGGPDGLDQPGIVVRYDAVTDLSDPSGAPDDDDVEGRRRVLARVSARPAGAPRPCSALWPTVSSQRHGPACATAYRYPRWAGVIVFSVLILGATALTRPGNPTPRAEIPKKKAAVPPSGPVVREDTKKDGKDPKEAPTAIAAAAPQAEGGKRGQERQRDGGPRSPS